MRFAAAAALKLERQRRFDGRGRVNGIYLGMHLRMNSWWWDRCFFSGSSLVSGEIFIDKAPKGKGGKRLRRDLHRHGNEKIVHVILFRLEAD